MAYFLFPPKKKAAQQQGALKSYFANVNLWHPFLAKGDNSETLKNMLLGFFCKVSVTNYLKRCYIYTLLAATLPTNQNYR
jgi:hypothetical protein